MSLRLILASFAALIALALVVPDMEPVAAQSIQYAQAQKRPGLFERLFGPRNAPPNSVQKRAPLFHKRAPVTRKKTTSRAPAPPAVPIVQVQPKDPNARKILVVGDYVADGVAWGLDQALAKEPKLAVVDQHDGSSGLVRTDHYDWNKEILKILNEETPDLVVVVLGANDRQDMRDGNQRYPLHSDKWEEIYNHRIDNLADTLKVYGRPFFWVSVPPVRGTSATADAAYLNGLFKPHVEKAGGYFVDVWNGFTNATGQYITTGPDIDGQNKALRTGDGVNFTSAGKLKLAYYVERDIRRATGIGSGTVDLLPAVTQSSTIEVGPDGEKRLVGPVISLSDPLPGASGELAGKPVSVILDPVNGLPVIPVKPPLAVAVENDETPQLRLVVKGEAPAPLAGRVDDFAWPPSKRASQIFVAPQGDAAEGEAPPPDAGDGGGEASLTPVSKSSQ